MKPIDEKKGIDSDPSIVNFSEDSVGKKILYKIKSFPPWIVVTIIALIFLIMLCLFPLLIIEVSNQWCNLFSGFFNAITPGICI
jgi:hypothetical protein